MLGCCFKVSAAMILMRDFVYDTDKSGKNFLKN